MVIDSEVKGRPLLTEYRGEHEAIVDFLFGFKARLVAIDYHGNAEVFYYETLLFEKALASNDIQLFLDRISAKEKLTQLLIATAHLGAQVTVAEEQAGKFEKPRFELSESYFQILNQAELLILKLSALLDVLARMSSHLLVQRGAKKVPPKYGQQKARNRNGSFNVLFDEGYQRRLLKNTVMNRVLEYRHLTSHERSLKLVPFRREDSWVLVLSNGSGEGLVVSQLIKDVVPELHNFIIWFGTYFGLD